MCNALVASPVAKLYVVRHARAVAPDDLRLPGLNPALRPEGWREARALAARLRSIYPMMVWTSDARRAQQTGEVIAEQCGIPLQVLPALREVDFGAWAGRTFAEVVADDPVAAAYFTDPTSTVPPGGESAASAANRVLTALQSLVGPERSGVVVVGHAGSLRLALAHALGMPLAAYWRFHLDYAGLSVLAWTSDGPVVEQLNDTAHLQNDRWSSEWSEGRGVLPGCAS